MALPLLEGFKTALVLIGMRPRLKLLQCMHFVNCHFITAQKRSLRRLCFYRCLSVHGGGGAAPRGVCIQGVEDLHPGPVCMPAVRQTKGYAQRAGGTYPTGMYSCLIVMKMLRNLKRYAE